MYRLYVYDPAFVLHQPGDGLTILDREHWADAKALYMQVRAEGKHADLYHQDEQGGLRLVSPAGQGVSVAPLGLATRPYDWLDALAVAAAEWAPTYPNDDWEDTEPPLPDAVPHGWVELDEFGLGDVVAPQVIDKAG